MRWQHKSSLNTKGVFILQGTSFSRSLWRSVRAWFACEMFSLLTFGEGSICLGNVLSLFLFFSLSLSGLALFGNVPCALSGLAREYKGKPVRLKDIFVLLLHGRRHIHTFCPPVLRQNGEWKPSSHHGHTFSGAGSPSQPCNAEIHSSARQSESHGQMIHHERSLANIQIIVRTCYTWQITNLKGFGRSGSHSVSHTHTDTHRHITTQAKRTLEAISVTVRVHSQPKSFWAKVTI